MVADTGAVARVERMISDRVAEALTALGTASIDETARSRADGPRHRRHQAAGMMGDSVKEVVTCGP